MRLTDHPALDDVLHTHAHTLRDVLAADFVGLYPLGSLAIGDFDLTSDVDFVVVIADELNDEAVEQVQAAHTDLMGRADRWVTRLEYSLFPLAQLHELTSPYGPDGERNDTPQRRHLDDEWQPLIEFCWQERQDTTIHVSQPANREAFSRTIEFMQHAARLAETYSTPVEEPTAS